MRLITIIAATIGIAVIFLLNACEPFLQKDISKYTIVLNAPQPNDTLTGNVSFWWNELEEGTTYRLQIVSPDFINPSHLLLDTIVDAYSYILQLPAGVYQWRVRGENANSKTQYATRTFFVIASQDLTTQSVILRFPSNNVAFKDSIVTFNWYTIATATSYYIQIVDSLSNVSFQQTVTDDSISIEFPLEGYYTWKVKASNLLTETVYSARSFYYDKTSPAQPASTFPVYNDTVSAGPVLLQWNRGINSGSPVTDSIFIYTDSLNTLSGIYFSTTPTYSLTTQQGTYFWRVRSRDMAGNVSPYSTTFKFTAE